MVNLISHFYYKMSGFCLKLEKKIFDDELIELQTFYDKYNTLKYVYKTEPQCLCFQNI